MRDCKKSFIMVFALLVFALLIVLVYSLASVARTEILKARKFIKNDRVYYQLLNGVFAARNRLLEKQGWTQKYESVIEYNHPVAKLNLIVEISDESAYLDLRTFKDELTGLFESSLKKIDYKTKDDEYLSLLFDYEDEDGDERNLGSEDKAKNAQIKVIDELDIIFNFEDQQLAGFKGLWCLAPSGAKFNINTASIDMINFLSDSFSKKYMFAKKIFDDILEYRFEEPGNAENYYNEEAWATLLAENPNMKTLFEKCFTINSSRFRIKSTVVMDGRKQSLITALDIEDNKFVYWRYE